MLLDPGAAASGATIVVTAAGLPATGRTIPFLAAGVAVGIALLLRAGRSKLDDDDRE